MADKKEIMEVLKNIKEEVYPVVKIHNPEDIYIFDLTEKNKELLAVDISNVEQFTTYVFSKMEKHHSPVAIGNYDENRVVYTTDMFKTSETPRTVHLGIDLWAEAGTPVFAPLNGRIHSFKNNAVRGDYGPTIILEHQVKGARFFTLYGHLSLDSLDHLKNGRHISGGQEIARIGNYPTNGNWPPHLHFQIITDMQGKKGDFCGVASLEDRKKYLELCPDPNLILNILTD